LIEFTLQLQRGGFSLLVVCYMSTISVIYTSCVTNSGVWIEKYCRCFIWTPE